MSRERYCAGDCPSLSSARASESSVLIGAATSAADVAATRDRASSAMMLLGLLDVDDAVLRGERALGLEVALQGLHGVLQVGDDLRLEALDLDARRADLDGVGADLERD